jgi:aminoglycoside phosphotransferase (APT) family kinase protein
MSDHELSRHFPTERFGKVREATTIEMGMSGAAVYAVTTDSGEYVLRCIKSPVPATWPRERHIVRVASANGIAPPLEWIDESAPATVSVRIKLKSGGSPFGDPASRPRVMASLVDMLAKLHSLPTDGVENADPLAEARKVWSEQRERPAFPEWAASLGDRLDECERLLIADDRRVLSHNDLNPANVLWDGERVWLVDWEVSGATHPYYDLAGISMFLAVDDATSLALLERQERTPITAQQAETFRALRRVANILYGAIFLRLVPDLSQHLAARAEDALTLAQVYGKIGSGELVLRSASGQAAFGSALLRQVLEQ